MVNLSSGSVKTGNAYAGQLMQGNPDISYAVSTEIYDKISEQSPGQMTDVGTYEPWKE